MARTNALFNYRNYGRLWRVYGRSVVRYGSVRKIANALRTEWAYRSRRSDVRSSPYLVFIEPLYYCNLSCPLCQRQTFPDVRRRDAGRLSIATYDKLLDELGDYLWQCHIFGLGEPLIDWPLTRQIIEKARSKRIFTLVSTNCTLLTPKIADEIVSCGLDYLVCAIDGTSQESYAAYRVGGKYEDALAGLKMVVEARKRHKSRIEIEWQFLVNAFNAHEVENARKIASELGVFIRFAPMGGMEWNEELQDRWLPPSPDWQDSRLEPGTARNSWHCYWLWRGVVINSNGQMARCPGYQNVKQLGHIDENSVADLYNGAETRRARQLFSKKPVPEGDYPTPCNTCSFYKRERGGPYLDAFESAGYPASNAPREDAAASALLPTFLPGPDSIVISLDAAPAMAELHGNGLVNGNGTVNGDGTVEAAPVLSGIDAER